MTDQEKIKVLEEKVQALEKIVSGHKITLTDPSEPNERIIIQFKDGQFKTTKETTTVTSQDLETITNP